MNQLQTRYRISELSKREKQVVQYIVDEYSTKEIARKMFVSFETIKSHRKSIITKLHVKSVAGIVREAMLDMMAESDPIRLKPNKRRLLSLA